MRVFHFLVAALLAFATPGAAETFPALYDVNDVEPGDVLAVHDAPEAAAQVIGTFAHDQANIEVIELDGTGQWGHVNFAEQAGWVPLEFLERTLQPGNSLLPRPLICFGTEPFWKLDISTGPIAELGRMGYAPRRFTGLWTIKSANLQGRYALMADSNGTDLTAILERKLCSDGMSDRVYGLDIDLVLRHPDGTQFFTGCCSLTP